MLTYFNVILLLMLIKSIYTHYQVKNKAIKRYYREDFLKLACSQYKVHQTNLFYTTQDEWKEIMFPSGSKDQKKFEASNSERIEKTRKTFQNTIQSLKIK